MVCSCGDAADVCVVLARSNCLNFENFLLLS